MSGPRPAAMTSQSASPGSPPTVNVHAVVGRLDVLDEAPGVDRDALLLEAALGELGDVGVLGRQHAVEALEERDLEPRRA